MVVEWDVARLPEFLCALCHVCPLEGCVVQNADRPTQVWLRCSICMSAIQSLEGLLMSHWNFGELRRTAPCCDVFARARLARCELCALLSISASALRCAVGCVELVSSSPSAGGVSRACSSIGATFAFPKKATFTLSPRLLRRGGVIYGLLVSLCVLS